MLSQGAKKEQRGRPVCENACVSDCRAVLRYYKCEHWQCIKTCLVAGYCIACGCKEPRFSLPKESEDSRAASTIQRWWRASGKGKDKGKEDEDDELAYVLAEESPARLEQDYEELMMAPKKADKKDKKPGGIEAG